MESNSISSIISVIVCTYNRCDILNDCLQSLVYQTLNKQLFEVIVVNNNSTDETQSIAECFAIIEPNFKVVIEPNQGLSHARNHGWNEAHGEYVAFIDDDCIVPTQWLSIAKDIVDQKSPGVFGGPYFAFYNSPKPLWFKDAYGSRIQGDNARALGDDEYLDGGNIFFRRSLLHGLGGFDTHLGMSGKKIAYGEETALLRLVRVKRPDQLIYYDPGLYVYHLVQAKKMNLTWAMRSRFSAGRYSYRIFRENSNDTGLGQPSFKRKRFLIYYDFGIDLLKGIFRRDREKYPYFQNYLFERVFIIIEKMGSLYEQFIQDRR